MSTQIEEIPLPIDIKKMRKMLRIPDSFEGFSVDSGHDVENFGMLMMFLDGLIRRTEMSLVTVDVFHEMSLEIVLVGSKSFPCKKIGGLLETIEIICDKELLKDIKQGLREIEEGKLISHKDFLKKHNLQ